MTLTDERIAWNQSLFRAANDRIEETARETDLVGGIPFICECPDTSCSELVTLSDDEYLGVRADPTHFVVVRGHEGVSGSAAVTLFRHDGYSVLREVGRAAVVAEQLERNPDVTEGR